jgi:hypothetical protein
MNISLDSESACPASHQLYIIAKILVKAAAEIVAKSIFYTAVISES